MSGERFVWDRDDPLARCTGERRDANDALRDYWLMGPGRSVRGLLEQYRQQSAIDPPAEIPPTVRLRTLFAWSSRYRWQARVDRAKEIADDEIAELEREARKQAILNSGFALRYERLASLQRLAELLGGEIYKEDKRWLPDVKQIGAGDTAERVDIVRFNSALIEQFRRTIADIASEMGERVKGVELRGPNGGPVQVDFIGMVAHLSDEELEQLIHNLDETHPPEADDDAD